MREPEIVEKRAIEPEIELGHGERAQLTALTTMEGYKILHRIMRSETDKFIVAAINSNVGESDDVLAKKLRHAKAAAAFYTAVTNRVNEEVMQYTQAPKANDKPLDVTAQIFDLGESNEQIGGVQFD